MSPTSSREKLPPRVSDLQSDTRRRRRQTFLISSLVFLIVLIVFSWWLAIRSDIFRFHTIKVEGNTRLTDQEVIGLLEDKIITQSFWRRSLGPDHFFAWPNGIDQPTIDMLGNIRSVRFVKDYWHHQISIFVEERSFFGTLCARRKELPECAWFDKEGFLFEDAFFPEGFMVFRLDDYSRDGLSLGQYIYSPDRLKNILSVFRVIGEMNLPAASWTIGGDTPDTLEVQLVSGPIIHFSLKFEATYTAQVIQSLIGQRGMANLEYIDFRTAGRVYYKDRSN